ncbi:hypothetical protein MiTs_02309 [Microcystis aeruginosa NIES-2521]|uniref:EF-hand domain-containing protein n=1 Tax=Microcystis aeruginosa NIES-2521 TaxID=2303983 RepID=A0A5A5S4C0_MICAE|nr:hypothetical protein MiTs_02309 [Microcystis aeruginosa NIES-2521]
MLTVYRSQKLVGVQVLKISQNKTQNSNQQRQDFNRDGVINFQDLAPFNKALNFPSNQEKNIGVLNDLSRIF